MLLSQSDALARAFPAGVAVEKRTAFLDEEQVRAIQKKARVKVDSRIWTYYVAKSSTGTLGYAYFDRTIVRTLPAALMVALDADGRVRFVEVLTFQEPEDYLPRKRWLGLFRGRGLSKDLRIGRKIHAVSGATLTARSFTDIVRRVLALHEILYPNRP